MKNLTDHHHTRLSMWFYLLLLLIALGPVNSKFLGLAWILFVSRELWTAFKTRNTPIDTKGGVLPAVSVWLKSCIFALILASICAFIWGEPIDTLNAYLRILFPAVAAIFLVRRGEQHQRVRLFLLHAITLACVVAFAWIIFLSTQGSSARNSLTTNAIPWAVAVSFYICLLLPAAFSTSERIHRWFWFFGIICGLAAIVISQTRGAFLIIPWCSLVYAWYWYRRCTLQGSFFNALLRLIGAIAVVLICSWYVPGDILRIHQVVHDIKEVQTSENYNTSTGARLYLWGLAWQGIQQSPWIGIGSAERLQRIKHAGESGSEEEFAKLRAVHELSHVHNQYLNSALDGGIIGLAAFLTLLIGLATSIFRLSSVDSIAAWQLGGVLFMHATSSVTNVNFLHNYYVVALSLAVAMPLLTARIKRT